MMIKAKEDTFHLGVKALIRNPDKEILLLERKSKFNKNYWGKVFDCAASQYGEGSCSFFNYFGKQLVKQIPVEANWQVLDVATKHFLRIFRTCRYIYK